MKVAFLGAFDPAYPRTRVLQEGLAAHGVEVRLLPVSSKPLAREAGLLAAWATRGQGADVVLVPSFGHRDVPLAALLARAGRVPLLFDPLVSRWDTQVQDLGRVRPHSFAAARLRASDALSMRLADLVLCDTWAHGELFAEAFGVPRAKLARVPVGADRAAFALGASRAAGAADPRADPQAAPRPDGPLECLYVGGFLPLHGVDTIVQAAALLEARHGPRYARFTLIGGGMTAHRAERDIAALGLRSVRRVARVPYAAALEAIAKADVALGIFGTTEKAARVIPHKVYQALAIGVPVLTRRSPAVRELFPEPFPMELVPPGNAEALAAAIEALAADPSRRKELAAAGRSAAAAIASPEAVGGSLLEAIARAGGRR